MSYLYVGLFCFLAGIVLDYFYQRKVVAAVEREANSLHGILDAYKQHLTEIIHAIKVKL